MRPYEIGVFEEEIHELPDFVPSNLEATLKEFNDSNNRCYGLREHESDRGSDDESPEFGD
jgi:hypothetical protein